MLVHIENLGPYRAKATVEGHEFYAEALKEGGVVIYFEVNPGSPAEDGHSPFYREAKSALGKHFRARRGDLRRNETPPPVPAVRG